MPFAKSTLLTWNTDNPRFSIHLQQKYSVVLDLKHILPTAIDYLNLLSDFPLKECWTLGWI